MALSQGPQHRGHFGEALQALLGADAQGAVCDHDYAAEDRLGAGISRVVQARLGEPAALCRLRLGRRRLLQRPARGHGSHKRQCRILVLIGATRRGRRSSIPRSRTAIARASSRGASCYWMFRDRRAHDRSRSGWPSATAVSASEGRGAEAVFPPDPRTAVLGPQDGQRPEQTPQGRSPRPRRSSHAPRRGLGWRRRRSRPSRHSTSS